MAKIRQFEEFDEELPRVAKVIYQRGIDFTLLTEKDEDSDKSREVGRSIWLIWHELMMCPSEMTHDEQVHYFHELLTGCQLVKMTENGEIVKTKKGYKLAKK